MKRDERQFKKNEKRFIMEDRMMCCGAIFCAVLFLAIADAKAADSAADYPSKPVEYVLHQSPGAPADRIGRVMSEIFQKEKILGQPLVVTQKPGSGGAKAQAYVLERKGNPHMVLMVGSAGLMTNPLLENLSYNYKSFTPIANLIVSESILVVKSDSPFKTANDLIAEAKRKPKGLVQGGGSFTGNDSLTGRSIQMAKGVEWDYVSFAGADAEGLLNVLNGNCHFAIVNIGTALDYIRTGKVRPLLAAAVARFPEFKDVPTMMEAGMGEPVLSYQGIVGPPGMPDYAVKKLAAAFKKGTETDRYKKLLDDAQIRPYWVPTDEYAKLLDKLHNQAVKVLGAMGLLKKK